MAVSAAPPRARRSNMTPLHGEGNRGTARQHPEKETDDNLPRTRKRKRLTRAAQEDTPSPSEDDSIKDEDKETDDNRSSAKKQKKLTLRAQEDTASPMEYVIIKKEDLQAMCDNVVCEECYESKMQCSFVHHHADTTVKIVCSKCKSSPMRGTSGTRMSVLHNVREVTLTLVHAIMLLGKGKAAFDKLCALMNLRGISSSAYNIISKYVTVKAKIKAEEVLEQSRKAVFEYYAKELNRLPDEDGVLDVDVTFGVSWQTRGNLSLLGVGDIIDVHSGLILDYETLSKLCNACSRKEAELKNKKITKEQFEDWYKEHSSSCDKNFEGTSLGMKPGAAVRLWQRSLDHNMRYTTYISDGDSIAFSAIKRLNKGEGPYGEEHEVVKEECVHLLSRKLGTALRALYKGTHTERVDGKKEKKKTSLGCKKFPDGFIAQMQCGLTESIKRAANTPVSEMRKSIMSSMYHYCSTDSKPRHHLCPDSSTSWCLYKKSVAVGETPPSHKDMKGHFELEPDQLDHVRRTFVELTSDETLRAILHAQTQNLNDSFHSQLWKYCPKDIFASKTKVDFAVAQTVCNFNAGYVQSSLHTLLGIPYTETVKKYLEKQDSNMESKLVIK
ncbi:uncharacterized protein LOC127005497 isoform X2 [Eriocheir sinensis]|uniref:uncharacterized protein LOC127005497 isoform X2 n=1 Tax=Eriocheir sinensis TaxID=95602 RepID=UPI0021C86935|nr:uncharacterized protein LOC127005497 isoform X2 [Eriocheir sinensis]